MKHVLTVLAIVTMCRWQICVVNTNPDSCINEPYQCGNWIEGELNGKQSGELVRKHSAVKLECMPKKLWEKKGWNK